ncbi:hypothetical protein D9M68_19670 [compost metagenome]
MKANCNCHFCNENEIRVLNEKLTPDEQGLKPGYQVECVNCGARGPSGYATEAHALVAWHAGDPVKDA